MKNDTSKQSIRIIVRYGTEAHKLINDTTPWDSRWIIYNETMGEKVAEYEYKLTNKTNYE